MHCKNVVVFVISLFAIPVNADLVGYWSFDGDVRDRSANGNHGELIDAEFTDDVPSALGSGMAIQFAAPEEHVFIPADESLDSPVFTLSMFVNDHEQFSGMNRFTSRQGDTFETAIDKVFQSDSVSYYSRSAGWVRTGEILELEEWNHLAYVADGDNMTVYVNGDAIFGPQPFRAVPTGFMHIGNRWNNVEGFNGLIDDVALWNTPLDATAIADLASGTKSPLEIVEPDLPEPPKPFLSVVSNVDTWSLSTESTDGGARAEWIPDDDPLPPASDTFTLAPEPAEPGVMGHIHAAGEAIGAQGLLADNDTHYYRTTFDLAQVSGLEAKLQMAVDNGAQVFINGELVATETSFLVENWQAPLPSLHIAADGAVTSDKFEEAVPSFSSWNVGANEIVLAVRNPADENSPAGGFAFRLDFFSPALPGDLDGNGIVDAADIDLLSEQIGGAQEARFDLDGSGTVDEGDLRFLVIDILNTYLGDSNLDGEFNSSDFVTVFVAGEYEDDLPFNSTWVEGDWNGDREFNSSDFVVAFTGGGYEKGPRPPKIPEPKPSVLLLGLLFSARWLRRQLISDLAACERPRNCAV